MSEILVLYYCLALWKTIKYHGKVMEKSWNLLPGVCMNPIVKNVKKAGHLRKIW